MYIQRSLPQGMYNGVAKRSSTSNSQDIQKSVCREWFAFNLANSCWETLCLSKNREKTELSFFRFCLKRNFPTTLRRGILCEFWPAAVSTRKHSSPFFNTLQLKERTSQTTSPGTNLNVHWGFTKSPRTVCCGGSVIAVFPVLPCCLWLSRYSGFFCKKKRHCLRLHNNKRSQKLT